MTAMVEDGVTVAVAAGYCDQASLDVRAQRVALVALDVDRHALNPIRDANLLMQLRKTIVAVRPDIVHSFTVKANLFTLAAVSSIGSPRRPKSIVITFAGLGRLLRDSEEKRDWRRHPVIWSFRKLRAMTDPVVTCENDADANFLVNKGIADKQKIFVSRGSGIDLSDFPFREKATRPVVVTFASRLLHAKGAGAFLEAARQFGGRQGIRFVMAGPSDPNDPDSLSPSEIEMATKTQSIEYLGVLDKQGMRALLEETHIFCLPTDYDEGLPRSITEAAAMGCAIITTPKGNTANLVEDGINGRVIRASTQLTGAINELAGEGDKLLEMGRRSIARVTALGLDDASVVGVFRSAYQAGLGERE